MLTHLKQRSEWGEGGTLLLKVDKGFTFHVCKKKIQHSASQPERWRWFFVVVADFSKVPAAAREEGGVLWVLCL